MIQKVLRRLIYQSQLTARLLASPDNSHMLVHKVKETIVWVVPQQNKDFQQNRIYSEQNNFQSK